MSFFSKIVKKIASKFKGSQQVLEPTYVDTEINEEPQFSGNITPEFIQAFVAEARKYLSLIDPANPLDSPLPPLPPMFRSPSLSQHFTHVANYVLKEEKNIDDRTADQIVNHLLGKEDITGKVYESDVGLTQEIINYVRSIPRDFSNIPPANKDWIGNDNIELFQSIVREMLSYERGLQEKQIDEVLNRMMTTEMEEKYSGLPESLAERVSNKNVKEEILFNGLAELDKRLGTGTYTIGERTGISDRYPIVWNSPESQQFHDTFLKEGSEEKQELFNYCIKSKSEGGSGMVNDIKNILSASGAIKEINSDEEIHNYIWEALSKPESIPLGRTESLNPNTGKTTTYKDYLVNFFIQFPQYLPKDIDIDTLSTDQKSWENRTRLSETMSSLILSKNKDVLNYVIRSLQTRIGNVINEHIRKSKERLSYDAPSSTGKSVKDVIPSSQATEVDRRDRAKQRVDRTSPEYQEAITDRKWNILSPYASTENGGEGNIFRGIYNEFGKQTVDSLSSSIEEKAASGVNPSRITRDNKVADALQIFMLLGVNQIDELFKPGSDLKNDKGKVLLDLKDGSVSRWANLIGKGHLFNTMVDVATAKKIISQMDRFSNDPNTIAQETRKKLYNQNITEETSPVVFAMLEDENFIRRSMLVDPSSIDKIYGVPTGNIDEKTYGKYARTFHDSIKTMHANFVSYALKALMDKERNILETSPDSASKESELNRLAEMRRIFSLTFPTHSELNLEQEKWDERIRQSREGKKRDPVGSSINKSITRMLNRAKGKGISTRDAWMMMTGKMPMPSEEAKKESNQLAYGLYRYGNSILNNLIRSREILGKFGLEESIVNVTNQIGDEYRQKIESLRE